MSEEVKPAPKMLPPPPLGGTRGEWIRWAIMMAALFAGAYFGGGKLIETEGEVREIKAAVCGTAACECAPCHCAPCRCAK